MNKQKCNKVQHIPLHESEVRDREMLFFFNEPISQKKSKLNCLTASEKPRHRKKYKASQIRDSTANNNKKVQPQKPAFKHRHTHVRGNVQPQFHTTTVANLKSFFLPCRPTTNTHTFGARGVLSAKFWQCGRLSRYGWTVSTIRLIADAADGTAKFQQQHPDQMGDHRKEREER